MTTSNDSNVSLPIADDSSPYLRRRPGRPKNTDGVGASEKKTSIYLKGDLLSQVQQEAARQDRSVSWVIAHALKVALPGMREMAGTEEVG